MCFIHQCLLQSRALRREKSRFKLGYQRALYSKGNVRSMARVQLEVLRKEIAWAVSCNALIVVRNTESNTALRLSRHFLGREKDRTKKRRVGHSLSSATTISKQRSSAACEVLYQGSEGPIAYQARGPSFCMDCKCAGVMDMQSEFGRSFVEFLSLYRKTPLL